jgi:uncharacterized membrane protein
MKRIAPIFLLLSFLLLGVETVVAQCAMCKAIPTSNQANGGTIADGLNTGILYLMAIPYLLLMSLVAYAFRHRIQRWWSTRKNSPQQA